MKIKATPIALAAFCMGMMVVAAAAAERDPRPTLAPQVALQPVAAASADAADESTANCLLPGEIRSFGGLAMLTPKRAVTLPASECTNLGGEPIAGIATEN